MVVTADLSDLSDFNFFLLEPELLEPAEAEELEAVEPFLLTIFTELRRCLCTDTALPLLFLLPVVDELTADTALPPAFLVSLLFFCFFVPLLPRLLLAGGDPLLLPLSEEVPV